MKIWEVEVVKYRKNPFVGKFNYSLLAAKVSDNRP